MNLGGGAGQHVLVDQQEVGIFAYLDAAALVLDEHLLGAVDGEGDEGLLTGQKFLRPPRGAVIWPKATCDGNLHDAERVVRTAAQCGIVRV